MGTVTSGVGLISGLPIQTLVDQLIAAQSRPVNLLKSRIETTTAVRTALLEFSARLIALKGQATRLGNTDLFRSVSVASSDEASLVATAATGASPGNYTFTVKSLAAAHQLISGGFSDPNTPLLTTGELTLAPRAARLDRTTDLALLNNGAGVRTGRIRITDRSGASAEVDLSAARSVADVVAAISSQTSAAVDARVEGDRIVLIDSSGGAGTLTVEDLNGGFAALDLGIRAASLAGRIDGSDVLALHERLSLSALNDGNGVRVHGVSDDLRITLADGAAVDVNLSGRLDSSTVLASLNGGAGVPLGRISITSRAGQSAEIDLTGATTIGDVITRITDAGIGLSATPVGSHLLITDVSQGTGVLAVADVDASGTTAALGLDATADEGSLKGRDIHRVTTLGDVLRAVNLDADNGARVRAEISADGDRIRLIDLTSGPGALTVSALNDSRAAADLGLLNATGAGEVGSSRLLAGLGGVLLRNLLGGAGATGGVVQITDRSGATATLDLSAAESLDDVVNAVNAAGIGVRAEYGESGLRIRLRDTSGGGGHLTVQDVSGTLASSLGLAVDTAGGTIESATLNRRFVSETSRLDQFGAKIPFVRGKFRLTDSAGKSAVVDLTQGDEVDIGDVIAEINSRGLGIVAAVNATGDGLLLTDTAGGGGRLTVAEEGGRTAESLGIVGQAAAGATTIDGGLTVRVQIGPADTLNSVISKIKSSRAAVTAALLNDGTSTAPYRLTLTSTTTGLAGRFELDAGATGVTSSALVEGRDAAVLFGSADSGSPLAVYSSSNTLRDVVPGITLTLKKASAEPVEVTVSEDRTQPVEVLKGFVEDFNEILDRIATLTKFDAETNARGLLLADPTAERVRSRLQRLTSLSVSDAGPFSRLADVGVRFSTGGRLSFDEARFEAAVNLDPAAVERLFTDEEAGLATQIETQLNQLAEGADAVIPRRDNALGDTIQALTQRQEQLQDLLDRQRTRLLAKFQAAEEAIARLQSQQTVLSSLSSLAAVRTR